MVHLLCPENIPVLRTVKKRRDGWPKHVLTCEGDVKERGGDFIGGSLGDTLRGLQEPEGGNERLALCIPQ